MIIKLIGRDWKGGYSSHEKESVKGMIWHGAEDELDSGGDGYNMMFVSEETDIPAQELYKIMKKICDYEEDVEGYQWVDENVIEKID